MHTTGITPASQASRRIAEHTGGEPPNAGKIDREQRENRAELDQHREGLAEIVIVEAEKALDQKKVAGRGHRQEFRDALDDAENHRLHCI